MSYFINEDLGLTKKFESVPQILGQLEPMKFRLLTFQHASTFSHKEKKKF